MALTAKPNEMSAVRDENLRLIFTEEERAYTDRRLAEVRTGIILFAVMLVALPLMAWFAVSGDVSLADRLRAVYGDTPYFATMFFVFLGLVSPLPLGLGMIYKFLELRKYLAYREEHRRFLEKYNRV